MSISIKEKISKEYYFLLKNKVKTYAAAGKAIRKEAVLNNGQVRYNLRNLKRSIGQDARMCHVALAFLRGKKYSEVEFNCKNPISKESLERFLKTLYILKWDYLKNYLDKDLDLFFGEEFDGEKSEPIKPVLKSAVPSFQETGIINKLFKILKV